MRTMSLSEAGHSTGAISLAEIMASGVVSAADPGLSIPDIVELVVRGGWPATLEDNTDRAAQYVRDYLDEIRRTDIIRIDRVKRDPQLVRNLLRSLARNIATEAALQTLATDVGGSENPLGIDTTRDYMAAVERLFVIEDQPAWAPQLRSKSRLRKSPKRHFVDPSLAVSALRASKEQLLADLNLFGFLFESMVVRDLRIYAQSLDGEVSHYRDNTGLEVDAIVETAGGDWAAFEIKLGGTDRIDQAAASLLKFRHRVDTSRIGQPKKLAVVVGTGYAYERADGVAVIPIGTLKA